MCCKIFDAIECSLNQGGRQDFQSEGALFSDDVIMTSLLLELKPKKVGVLAPYPAPPLPTPLQWLPLVKIN